MSKIGKIVLDFLEDHDGDELTPEDIQALNDKVLKEFDSKNEEHKEKTVSLDLTISQLEFINAMLIGTFRSKAFDNLSYGARNDLRNIADQVDKAEKELLDDER